jgi:hypothetical protein
MGWSFKNQLLIFTKIGPIDTHIGNVVSVFNWFDLFVMAMSILFCHQLEQYVADSVIKSLWLPTGI